MTTRRARPRGRRGRPPPRLAGAANRAGKPFQSGMFLARFARWSSVAVAYCRRLPMTPCHDMDNVTNTQTAIPTPGPGLKPARRGSPFGYSSAPTASAIAAPRITDDGPPALTDQRTPCNSTSAVEWSGRTTGRSRSTAGAERPQGAIYGWLMDPEITLILSPAQAVATLGSQRHLRVARTRPRIAPRTRQSRYS